MADQITYADFYACLKYLEQEGFVEIFLNEKGEQMIRIAEGAENL